MLFAAARADGCTTSQQQRRLGGSLENHASRLISHVKAEPQSAEAGHGGRNRKTEQQLVHARRQQAVGAEAQLRQVGEAENGLHVHSRQSGGPDRAAQQDVLVGRVVAEGA